MPRSLSDAGGGRPAQRYAYNPDYFSVLSLYSQGSDAAAQIIWSVNSATGVSLAQGEVRFLPLSLETFYQQIAGLLADYPNIKALGIGLPGVVVKGRVQGLGAGAHPGRAGVSQPQIARHRPHPAGVRLPHPGR